MQFQVLFGPAAAVAGAATVMAWRVQETRRPVSLKSILLPPLGMSTGFFMFAVPQLRLPWSWAVAAFLAGALLFSWPLARSSRLERAGDVIVLRRSRAFLLILLVLAAIRLALRSWIDQVISPLQTGALFFVLAFGMILVWRLRMLRDYRALHAGTR
ncbi:MAG: cytochrome c biogenesis protein CcdC [Gemmatimonadetes bacterium]|nr:cytochrome c biogenesis protein CcdC [Gemmatimonadota bacterium]